MSFKLGSKVRQIVPAPIEGHIVNFSPDSDARCFRNEVAWVDENGVEHRKVFDDDEIELIPDEADPAQ